MVRLTLTNMARPKKVNLVLPPPPMVHEAPPEVVPTMIEKLSIDYGREDINNIAKKINEIINYLYGKDIPESPKDAQEQG